MKKMKKMRFRLVSRDEKKMPTWPIRLLDGGRSLALFSVK